LEWQADAGSSSQESFPYEIAQPHAQHEANTRAVAKLNSQISNLKSEISKQEPQSPLVVDTRPLIRALVDELLHNHPASAIAHRFHLTLACIIADICRALSARTGITPIVLSGGVFMNVLLLRETRRRLADAGLQVFSHHQVPPNDGGLSLGQLAVAAARLQQPPKENATDVPGHSRPRD
jgi:hydrogenase maturation factor HypF (carbamoyltransferase family)